MVQKETSVGGLTRRQRQSSLDARAGTPAIGYSKWQRIVQYCLCRAARTKDANRGSGRQRRAILFGWSKVKRETSVSIL